MDSVLRRCLLMSVGGVALGGVLLAAGVPGAVKGQHSLAVARRASEPRDEGVDLVDLAGSTG